MLHRNVNAKRHLSNAWNWGGVVIPLIKLNKYHVFLTGMGEDFESFYSYFTSNDVNIDGIISLSGDCGEEFDGVPIIPIDKADAVSETNSVVIITDTTLINTYRHRQVIQFMFRKWKCKRAMNILGKHGFHNSYVIRGSELASIYAFSNIGFYHHGRIRYYKSHMDELKRTYDMLCDDSSKEIMVEYLRAYLQSDRYMLQECDGRNKYFAGFGRDESKEELYNHLEDEVWINCGSSIGDSVMLYFADGYTARKIYAFEGSHRSYRRLCRNVAKLPEQYRDHVQPVQEFISDETNWNDAIHERITLLNADIEGTELTLLNAMKERIKNDRPVLAICVYHRKEDLVAIPKLIDETVDGYRYLLRKYTCGSGHKMCIGELVLYAIPEERFALKF